MVDKFSLYGLNPLHTMFYKPLEKDLLKHYRKRIKIEGSCMGQW